MTKKTSYGVIETIGDLVMHCSRFIHFFQNRSCRPLLCEFSRRRAADSSVVAIARFLAQSGRGCPTHSYLLSELELAHRAVPIVIMYKLQ